MKASTLRQVRLFHNYIAVFFAPAILFFAFTGALQTIGLHEAHGDEPAPPRWIVAIANLHKHQVIAGPRRHRPDGDHQAGPAAGGGAAHLAVPGGDAARMTGPGARPAGSRDDHDHDHGGFGLLKAFVLLLSVALFAATLLGLVIALATRSTRRLAIVLTTAGLVVPLAMVLA